MNWLPATTTVGFRPVVGVNWDAPVAPEIAKAGIRHASQQTYRRTAGWTVGGALAGAVALAKVVGSVALGATVGGAIGLAVPFVLQATGKHDALEDA